MIPENPGCFEEIVIIITITITNIITDIITNIITDMNTDIIVITIMRGEILPGFGPWTNDPREFGLF